MWASKSRMNKMIYIYCFYFAVCQLAAVTCFCQAFQLTQFYAAPTFLNPAFAGTGSCQRLTTNYRSQWPSIPGGYKTYLLSFDHSIARKNSGIGFLFTNDKAGSGNLRSTGFNAQYSYHLVLGRKWVVTMGAEAGYVQRNYDFYKFTFGDQIAHGTSTTVEEPAFDKVGYSDLSSGALLFSENTWLGFSARHINQPDQALVSGESRLPVLYSVHGGWIIPVVSRGVSGKSYTYFSPAINYRAEERFDQLDIGCYYNYQHLVIGAWYRGIPLFKAYKPGYPNNDALALIAGFIVDRFKFGYSYDITISWLVKNTAGAHEISLSYQFCDPKKKRKKSAIPCPKF